MTEAYNVPFKFTGKIAAVTFELKEMKKADRDHATQARKAALKRGLADEGNACPAVTNFRSGPPRERPLAKPLQ